MELSCPCDLFEQFIQLELIHEDNLVYPTLLDNVVGVCVADSQALDISLILLPAGGLVIHVEPLGQILLPDFCHFDRISVNILALF